MKTNQQPHSPCIQVRETLDNGYSKGLGFHFQPNEEYWLDCHNHLNFTNTSTKLQRLLDDWFSRLDAYRLGKVLAIAADVDSFEIYANATKQDERFGWIVRLQYDKPDVSILEKAIENGACGLKLHNAPLMRGHADPDIWLGDDWSKIFSIVEEKGIPILWHVAQRMSSSPYHGGGECSYWKEGYKKGVTFTNEDLLGVTLEILKRYPKLKILGAHQLHLGLERLSSLFEQYENLYIDTSCCFFLRWADTLYENDRMILKDFFEKHQDRILFGTDTLLEPSTLDQYRVEAFLCHARLIKQVRLDDEALQKISHKNAEKLFNQEPLKITVRGFSRP